MSVQSDKWIIQMARDNKMISPFEDKQVEEIKYHLVSHHMVMMREFRMNLKFSLT